MPASARRKPRKDAVRAGLAAPTANASRFAGPLWFVRVRSSSRRLSLWYAPAAAALTAPCGGMDAAALSERFKAQQSPARAGLSSFRAMPGGHLSVVAATTPVAAAPATSAMPAIVPATPTTAAPVPTMPAAMTAAAPAHLFRREPIRLLARGDGGLRIGIDRQFDIVGERRRHQRRGLRACCKRGTAGGKSKGKFQKVAALHHVSSFVDRVRRTECRSAGVNAR